MSLRILVPAFMISELKRAFEIGFLLFLPFLIIDLVVASVLMSMGMMMLPPVVVSLPFKLDLLRAGRRLAPGRRLAWCRATGRPAEPVPDTRDTLSPTTPFRRSKLAFLTPRAAGRMGSPSGAGQGVTHACRTLLLTTSLAAGLLMLDVAQPMLTGEGVAEPRSAEDSGRCGRRRA